MKTSELTGSALDWAVCRIENPEWWEDGYMNGDPLCALNMDDGCAYAPSTDWQQGGEIIERECIDTLCLAGGDDGWQADKYLHDERVSRYGSTPLIAAMRCYVASKLGDEVEVPDELKGE